MDLHQALLAWYDAHKRDLPWRRTSDPYAIWVSEIMLQQTQVATVLPYYERWMARFPTVESLAVADEQDVLAAWQGLGYYRRCKLLLSGARYVVESRMPRSAPEWLRVPGVGRYTAGAIASIAMREAVPVVDGNVQRVMARLTGCSASGRALEKKAWQWAEEQVPTCKPGDWNQALMELGATVCMPRRPACGSCPVRGGCVAFAEERVEDLPRMEPQPTTVHLSQRVWVPRFGDLLGVRQIPLGQWWAGMWEFPRGTKEIDLYPSAVKAGEVKHSVTHHRITLEVFVAQLEEAVDSLKWCSSEELAHLPMPAPQRKALKVAVPL